MQQLVDGVSRAITFGRWAVLFVLPILVAACKQNNGGGGY
jgi:hypothetical protein